MRTAVLLGGTNLGFSLKNLRQPSTITLLIRHFSQSSFPMTDKLPPQLLNLFAPRPPLRYLLPHDSAPESRKTPIVSGLAHFLSEFNSNDNDYVPTDTAEQLKEKRRAAKQARNQKMFRDGIENCTGLQKKCKKMNGANFLCVDDPASDPQVRGDPFCTLFVSRLSYDTTEHDLERAFGTYGPIERVLTPSPFLRNHANCFHRFEL